MFDKIRKNNTNNKSQLLKDKDKTGCNDSLLFRSSENCSKRKCQIMLEKSEGTCEKGNEYQCTPKHFYINKKNLKNQQVRPYISQPKLHFESIETDNIFDYGNPKICIKLELEDNNSGVDDARSNHKRLKNHLEAGKSADLKN